MSNDQVDLEVVEQQIQTGEAIQKFRDDLIKLQNYPEWKNIIEEGYFKEEAARLVMAKSADLSPDSLRLIDNMISGVGAFAQWLEGIKNRGRDVDRYLPEWEETRNEIIQGEGSH